MTFTSLISYYGSVLVPLGFWALVTIGCVITLFRGRSIAGIIQIIAAILALAVLICDYIMMNPHFGFLRFGTLASASDTRTFYLYGSLCMRAIAYFTFGVAFLFDRLTASRNAVHSGFVPEPVPQYRAMTGQNLPR